MNTIKKDKSRNLNLSRILILSFCAVVTICVICVLFFVYEPNQNSPGALGSAWMDVVCMIILLIPVISILLEREEIGSTTQLFLALLVVTKWALFFDFLTWSLDGSLKYSGWTYWFTLASLVSGSILAFILVLYLSSYIIDMYDLKPVRIRARICAVCNIAAFIVTVALGITHYAFEFINGHYVLGTFYDVITVIPILTLVYMTGYAIKNVKIVGWHDAFAIAVYMLTMITGAILEAVLGIGATYVSVTIADVYIFVMLQNRLIVRTRKQKEELAKNVEKWMKRSNTDEVTGFLNRHAYEEEIVAIEKRTIRDNFVYFSMDVNGLKVVNDTLGHEAGDELIIGASVCMRKCFSQYGKLFRIGGDEFVALLIASDSELENIKKEFDEVTSNWRGKAIERLTISYGYVTRKEAEGQGLHQMAVLADKRMYENKRLYYQNKGVDRRGQRDAHVALCSLYTKILKIDIEDDTYQIVNMKSEEQTKERGFSEKLSEWLSGFGSSGMVHPDDLEEYLSKTDLDYISDHFKNNDSSLRLFYRRRYADKYKNVMMELIPAGEEHGDNIKNLFLYVKDISK